MFEGYDVHMLRNLVSCMFRSFSFPPTAIPCVTFLISVCIAELKDYAYSICDKVFKEYGKRVGKWIDKLCENFLCKTKVLKLVQKHGAK